MGINKLGKNTKDVFTKLGYLTGLVIYNTMNNICQVGVFTRFVQLVPKPSCIVLQMAKDATVVHFFLCTIIVKRKILYFGSSNPKD